MYCLSFATLAPTIQEAVERAYKADSEGDTARALKLYQTGLQAIQEALQLQVAGSGEAMERSAALAEWTDHLGPCMERRVTLGACMFQWAGSCEGI